MTDTTQPRSRGHLDTFEAADYLRLSRRRLDRYRSEGNGPRFRKFGQKVVYAIADLDAWSEAHAHQATYEPGYPNIARSKSS